MKKILQVVSLLTLVGLILAACAPTAADNAAAVATAMAPGNQAIVEAINAKPNAPSAQEVAGAVAQAILPTPTPTPGTEELLRDLIDELRDNGRTVMVTPGVELTGPVNEPERGLFTAAQIDAVLGSGNWSCFPDRLDGVAIHELDSDLLVQLPLSAVDKGRKYNFGETVPASGGATAWLAGQLATREECPNPGQVITTGGENIGGFMCRISQFGPIVFRPPADDENFGRMVKIDASAPFTAPEGWSFDREGVKYTPGMTVPAGVVSSWAPEECYDNIQ